MPNNKIISLDIESVLKKVEGEVELIRHDLTEAFRALAPMTRAKVSEMAQNELKSSRKTLEENLSWQEISPSLWVVTIHEPAAWIEDGLPANFDMKPGLLKGKSSRVIPFDHSKGPKNMNNNSQRILKELKTGLNQINRERKLQGLDKVSLNKIEKNADGSPRVGKLHEFDIASKLPTPRANTPALQGLAIYQNKDEKTGKVTRQAMTFRTVSSGPASKDKWIHPGAPKRDFLKRAGEWVEKEFLEKIVPEVLARYKK